MFLTEFRYNWIRYYQLIPIDNQLFMGSSENWCCCEYPQLVGYALGAGAGRPEDSPAVATGLVMEFSGMGATSNQPVLEGAYGCTKFIQISYR